MDGNAIGYAKSFGVAFVVSVLATLTVRGVARHFGWVARPRPDRWHSKPTALYGGIAIYAGFLASYLTLRPAAVHGDALLVLSSTGVFLVGLVDDRVQLKPYAKLIGQIACATLITAFGLRLHWLNNEILDQSLTIFWLVGITNALNLLDNIDGAAGGIALIAAGYLIYFGHLGGGPVAATLAAAFAGGVAGFLLFNFNPASIFMGDCGSLFLGFFLGGLSLISNSQPGARRNTVAILTLPVLLLLMPIIDTTLVTITRRYHGRSISQGGRDHTSHRLVALGLTERQATLSLWATAAASGAIAVTVRNTSTAFAIFLLAAFAMAILFLMIFLGRVRVYEPVESVEQAAGHAMLPTLADFTYKRRIFETLNDLVLIILCYYTAFLLRFEPQGEQLEFLPHFIQSVPLVVVTQLSVFLAAGLYRGVWRYTDTDDLGRMVRAVSAAIVCSTLGILFVFRFQGFSRAVMLIDGVLLLLSVAGSRLSFRFFRDWLALRRPRDGKRILIYGAGDGGELLLRELRSNHSLNMVPVAFVDDDPQKTGRTIHGVPVVGSLSSIESTLATFTVDEIVVSTTKLDPEHLEILTRACLDRGLTFRRMRIAFE